MLVFIKLNNEDFQLCNRLSKNLLSVVSRLFAKIYPNFGLDRFFKTKKKNFEYWKKNLKKFTSIRTNSKSEAVNLQFLPSRARISTLDEETASSHQKS